MALRHLNRHLLPLYVRPEITFTHGKGSVLHSTCGRSFLDFTAGIAVNALGHGDETIAKVMADQTAKLVHISNLYHNEHAGPFATRIVESMVSHGAWQDQQVFFCSSGTEANEGALKFARKYCRSTASKTDILAFKGGFHGRSMGALSATFNPKYQEPFQPLVPGFGVAAFNDMDAIGRITSSTAAVLIEPIQGEGGVHVADMAFIKAVRDKCTEMGALLILDEVQCGLARTGKLHAYENFGIVPDILTMAKPIVSAPVAKSLKPGDHGTTFGGSPLATRIGLELFSRISNPEFLKHVLDMGLVFEERSKGLPHVIQSRGKGLLRGIQLAPTIDLSNFTSKCLSEGLLVVSAGSQTIRLIPPLVITEDQVNQGMDIIEKVLASY